MAKMLRGRILEMNSRKTPYSTYNIHSACLLTIFRAYARYTGPPSPASSVIVAIYYWEFDCCKCLDYYITAQPELSMILPVGLRT